MITCIKQGKAKNKEGAKKRGQMMENASWETSVEGRLRKRGEGRYHGVPAADNEF